MAKVALAGAKAPTKKSPKKKVAKPKVAKEPKAIEARRASGADICGQFQVVIGSFREALLKFMAKNLGKPVTVDQMSVATYGAKAAEAQAGRPVIRVLNGIEWMIEQGKLPYEVKKMKDGRSTSYMLAKKK
jgi:hypothetical protein